MRKKIGIVGFGEFTWFMCKHLSPWCEIIVYSRRDISEKAQEVWAEQKSMEEVCGCEIVILSVVVQHFESVVQEVSKHVKPWTLVLDVSSVKVKPTELMIKYLPKDVEIITTHPLFWLESGKHGIKWLKMVVCDVRSDHTKEFIQFLREKLELNVLEKTPEEHDKQMAYAQALSHFIAKALTNMNIPTMDQNTLMYDKLRDMVEITSVDTEELFLTLETQNPYGKEIREKFVQELNEIEKWLSINV